jgi:hypothetical protein
MRWFTLASMLSLSLSVALALSWLLSYRWAGSLSLGTDYSIQWRDGRVEISNLGHFILSDVDGRGGPLKARDRSAPAPVAANFHRFVFRCGPTSLAMALLPALWLACLQRRRLRQDPRQCRHCGYSLIGNESGVCPECGAPVRLATGGEDAVTQ